MTPNQGDHSVKFKPGARFASTAVALTVTSALLLSACSSSKKSASSTTTSAAGHARPTGSSAAATVGRCPSGTLKGEGSTAQTNAMTSWVNGFQKQCSGATVNYNPTGSGPGVAQFIGKQVNFAGSDAALDPTAGEPAKAKTACGSTALDLPMVVGPVAVAFKLKGIADGGITLTPKVTTQIFLGKITKWNDPAITAINKGVSLPADEHHRVLPLRPVRYDLELREVPGRQRPDRLHRHAQQDLGRQGRPGQGQVAGRAAGARRPPKAASATSSTPSRSAATCPRPRSTTVAARSR